VWACQVNEVRKWRLLMIWLPAIGRSDVDARADARLGLTARQVQEVIDRERELDEYIWVKWGYRTGKAMTAWHAAHGRDSAAADGRHARAEELAWQALTGVLVEAIRLRPEELRDIRAGGGYGPASNYWSPGSFGTSF
jgi:hypothetical protein